MASISDFKLLGKCCRNYFNLAVETQSLDTCRIAELKDIDKERFGFYYFILNKTIGEDDFEKITSSICDQDFNSKIKNTRFSDEGIDAVVIDEEEHEIHLYNFKYREKYNSDASQKKNEAIISSKFLNVLKTENNNLEGPLKDFANEIIEKYNSKQEWNTYFYIVSNDAIELQPEDATLKNFSDIFDVHIVCIGLDTISTMILPKHKEINAKIILPSEAIMSFSESPRSSNVSYVTRIRLTDLVRITCNNEEWRNNYQMEDEKVLSSAKEEYDVLFDNVRGLIGKSKFNHNITRTLTEEPSKFFFFNNGLTFVAKDIDFKEINSGKRIKLEIKNFQILNGGQTLRTIHLFNQSNENNISNNLALAEVLVRILRVTDPLLKNQIGEYTNSQNSIKASDLKSLSKEQFDIECFLSEHGISYIRKRGDVGIIENKKFDYIIGMERLGQILWAVKGFPEMVSNKKKEIFTDKYDELFCNDNILSQGTIDLIKKYYDISRLYRSTQYDFSEQKNMYILYLSNRISNMQIDEIIKKFEQLITDYLCDNSMKISRSRVLIQSQFKDFLDDKFNL